LFEGVLVSKGGVGFLHTSNFVLHECVVRRRSSGGLFLGGFLFSSGFLFAFCRCLFFIGTGCFIGLNFRLCGSFDLLRWFFFDNFNFNWFCFCFYFNFSFFFLLFLFFFFRFFSSIFFIKLFINFF